MQVRKTRRKQPADLSADPLLDPARDYVYNLILGRAIKVEHARRFDNDGTLLWQALARNPRISTRLAAAGKDRRIGRRPLEREAIINAGGAAFVLTGGDMRGIDVAEAFARALPTMIRCSQKRARPFLATVSAGGTVTMKFGGERLGSVKRG